MRKTTVAQGVLLLTMLLLAPALGAQADSQWFVRPLAEVMFPLNSYADPVSGETKPLYSTGYGVGALVDYRLFRWLSPFLRGEYGVVPYLGDSSLQFVEADAGVGFTQVLADQFAVRLDLMAGLSQLTLPNLKGTAYALGTRLSLDYRITPEFTLSAGSGYSTYLGSQSSILSAVPVDVYLTYDLSSIGGEKPRLKVDEIKLEAVFPSLYAYYDENSFGTVRISNGEDAQITDVVVSFNATRYMDRPKVCAEYTSLKSGGTVAVPVKALFTDAVLDLTQGSEVKGEVIVTYKFLGSPRVVRQPVDLRMHHRNAITWSDDRRAGAFVSPTNPAALWFARYVTGIVNDRYRAGVNRPLQLAMGMFEAERLYGLNYVLVPANDYAVKHEIKDYIDSVQFPHQTLTNRGGDCSDLAILFASLMQSVGVETAFITIPGHIYSAFDTGLTEAQAKETFSDPALYIVRNGKVWVPLEITMLKDGFLKAWRVGAKEWVDNVKSGNAAFYALSDCWKKYPSTAFPNVNPRFALPAQPEMAEALDATLDRYALRELTPKLEETETQLAQVSPAARANEIGLLYVSYGLVGQAWVHMTRSARAGFQGAWTNLGNLAYLQKDYALALEYYQHSWDVGPSDEALLGLARCQFELENFDEADRSYAALKARNPALAGRFGYLGSVFGGEGRAWSWAERSNSAAWVTAAQQPQIGRLPGEAAPQIPESPPSESKFPVFWGGVRPQKTAPGSRVAPPMPPPADVALAPLPELPPLEPEPQPELAMAEPSSGSEEPPEPSQGTTETPKSAASSELALASPEVAPLPLAPEEPAPSPAPAPVPSLEPEASAPAVETGPEVAPELEGSAPPAKASVAKSAPRWKVIFSGPGPMQQRLNPWQLDGETVQEANVDQSLAQLLSPVVSLDRKVRYSVSAKTLAQGWTGWGLFLELKPREGLRQFVSRDSLLVWVTHDPVHFPKGPDRVQVFRSVSGTAMTLLGEAPLSRASTAWNRLSLEFNAKKQFLVVTLNSARVLQVDLVPRLGDQKLIALRSLAKTDFKDFVIEVEP